MEDQDTIEKAANWGAKHGQTIAGKLGRDNSGRFANTGGSSAAATIAANKQANAATPAAGKGRAKKGPSAETQARRAAAAERRSARLSEAGRRRAVRDFQQAEKRKVSTAKKQQAEAKRLARQAEIAARKQKRDEIRLARKQGNKLGGMKNHLNEGGEKKPKPGKGSKPPKAKPSEEQKQAAKEQQRQANRAATTAQMADALNEGAATALDAFARGATADPDMLQALADETGLVDQGTNGEYRMTTAGRAYQRALDHGDARGAQDALSRGRESLQKKNKATLSILRDKAGQLRWIAVSSNAFEDRDREIVSQKALETDVARADADGDYGPLLWWHEPSLRLGTCDFNAMHGKMLIESGTFDNERIGLALVEKAEKLQVSIRFRTRSGDPDQDGAFHFIRREERSIAPAGKVKNPWTAFAVREDKTMTPEKEKALMAILDDDPAAQAEVRSLLARTNQTEKALEAEGIRSKADDQISVPRSLWEQIKEAFTPVASKAEGDAAAAVEEAAPEPEADAATEEDTGDEAPLFTPEEVDSLGAALEPRIEAAVSRAMAAAMEPVMKGLNVAGQLDELKALMGGQSTQKAEAEATRAEEIASLQGALAAAQAQHVATVGDLQSRLKALEGEQPRAAYRASIDPATAIGDNHRLKGQEPEEDPMSIHFNKVLGALGGQPVPS